MFGKFFASTFTGSMCGAGATEFAVWGYVIANAVNSTVELNPVLLAAIIGTDAASIERAITWLMEPDPKSRNPDCEGRRLIHENGFQYRVTSHAIYRALRNEADRRAYNREAQQKSRAARKQASVNPQVTEKKRVKPIVKRQYQLSTLSAHTEAEAEAEAEAEVKADLNQIQLANKQQGEPAADSDPKPERPMFTGQRLVVFPWMEEKLTRLLGPNIERFDLLDWLMRLDSKIAKSSELIPQRDGGAWLLAQATAEAERLGFSIAKTAKPKRNGGLSSGANCTHSPRCDTFAVCRDRILRETRDS